MVLALLVALLLVAGCSSNSQQDPGSSGVSQPQSGAEQTPETAKDSLIVVNSVEVPTFDPQKVTGLDAIVAVANMYDRLVYLDADGTLKPWLATKWSVADDNRTWTFELRNDARFHDGTPLTSEAVKWSFERAIGPDSPSSLGKVYLSPIEKVEAPDPYTVKIITKAPFAPLLNHLGHQTAAVILNPKVAEAHGNDLSKAVDAGSGMYKLVEWQRNEQLVLERNEDWWGPKPAFKRIVYKPVPDAATRLVMLEKGEVDVVTSIPAFEVARLKQNQELKVIETSSVRAMFFAFHMAKPPVDNVKVRQAINMAVDVDGIIQAVLEGYGERARSVLTPNLPFYHAGYNFDYDLAAAQNLLQEAGVQPGASLILHSPQGRWPMDAEIAQAVAGNLTELGFDVEVRVVGDWAKYQQEQKEGQFHLTMTAWAPGSLDADGTLSAVTASTGSNNRGKYHSQRADELIKQGSGATDPATRAQHYKELQELIGTDVPYLLLHNSKAFSATRANICGVNVRGDEAHIIKDATVCQ